MKMGIAVQTIVLAGVAGSAMADTLVTFENIPGDIQAINNFYSGITFGSSSTGSPLVTRRASTGNYNVSSYDLNTSYGTGEYWIYGDVGVTSALDNSGNDGKITFDNADATYATIAYCCNSTFTLEAYDINGNLLDSSSGGANLRYANGNSGGPGQLTVNWNGTDHIAYVIVHDTGNYWVLDNVMTDATGLGTAIPLPTSAAMAGFGLFGLAARRRR